MLLLLVCGIWEGKVDDFSHFLSKFKETVGVHAGMTRWQIIFRMMMKTELSHWIWQGDSYGLEYACFISLVDMPGWGDLTNSKRSIFAILHGYKQEYQINIECLGVD